MIHPTSGTYILELLGFQRVAVTSADYAMEMPVTARIMNGRGAVHGGLLATLVDTTAGLALARRKWGYHSAATTQLTISYLRPVQEGRVTAEATVVSASNQQAVVRVDVYRQGEGEVLHVVTSSRRSPPSRRAAGSTTAQH
jgi:uncharacterized protein (TIGR00369 family)